MVDSEQLEASRHCGFGGTLNTCRCTLVVAQPSSNTLMYLKAGSALTIDFMLRQKWQITFYT